MSCPTEDEGVTDGERYWCESIATRIFTDGSNCRHNEKKKFDEYRALKMRLNWIFGKEADWAINLLLP